MKRNVGIVSLLTVVVTQVLMLTKAHRAGPDPQCLQLQFVAEIGHNTAPLVQVRACTAAKLPLSKHEHRTQHRLLLTLLPLWDVPNVTSLSGSPTDISCQNGVTDWAAHILLLRQVQHYNKSTSDFIHCRKSSRHHKKKLSSQLSMSSADKLAQRTEISPWIHEQHRSLCFIHCAHTDLVSRK